MYILLPVDFTPHAGPPWSEYGNDQRIEQSPRFPAQVSSSLPDRPFYSYFVPRVTYLIVPRYLRTQRTSAHPLSSYLLIQPIFACNLKFLSTCQVPKQVHIQMTSSRAALSRLSIIPSSVSIVGLNGQITFNGTIQLQIPITYNSNPEPSHEGFMICKLQTLYTHS